MKSEMKALRIAAVPKGTARPYWSVMIPTFNCAKYLRQALESVLAQDPGPEEMQIEVIDDVSNRDDPEKVVREVAGDRILFFRNPENLGATRNFNRCIERSRGHLVHILHGDDFVLPEFYHQFQQSLQSREDLNIAVCRAYFVDESSEIDALTPRLSSLENGGNALPPLSQGCPIQTPSVVVRRRFYEQHGGFDQRLCHTADWEMWLRAFGFGKGISINRPLACYRTFAANDTSQLAKTGENIRDYNRLAEVLKERRVECNLTGFRIHCLHKALQQRERFAQQGDAVSAQHNSQVWSELAEPADWIVHGFHSLSRRLKHAVRPG